MGPLLRELEAEVGKVPGSALTEPLTAAVTEAIEALWRALGLEVDRVVNDARQQFERDLKAEQAARIQAEAATARTQAHLQAAQTTLADLETALATEQSAREQREWETLGAMMTVRLADKDALIATLQQRIAEPSSDPDASVGNDTGGV